MAIANRNWENSTFFCLIISRNRIILKLIEFEVFRDFCFRFSVLLVDAHHNPQEGYISKLCFLFQPEPIFVYVFAGIFVSASV
ncbi:hypothetical protein SAMN05421747_11791 [Parapedobacter composti]|uniref:Uncharacterized protein n=1 Tax=Parapedobacter composti TaxID=623281 RepID=A0A1I1KXT8_9SPHI|nr:hypothetical protein SAMN05421747_11791 [Parapedobacter composti]